MQSDHIRSNPLPDCEGKQCRLTVRARVLTSCAPYGVVQFVPAVEYADSPGVTMGLSVWRLALKTWPDLQALANMHGRHIRKPQGSSAQVCGFALPVVLSKRGIPETVPMEQLA